MKQITNLATKLVEKVKENKEASVKLVLFGVILSLALAYPLVAAIGGALACMIAIDHRQNARKSLSFFTAPFDVLKALNADMKAQKADTANQETPKEPENKEEVK